MKRPTVSIVLFGCALLACTALAGCDRSTIEFIPSGGPYTMTQVEDLAAQVSLADVEDEKTANGPALREEALLELRKAGADASLLADALTRDFPSGATSVPLLVEGATVDGVEAWIVVEAWGDGDGTLSRRRVWVLDRSDFTILGSTSFN